MTLGETLRKIRWNYVLRIAALAAVYILAARLGLSLGAVGKVATAVWPPTGIALVALVFFGLGLWPGIALGAFIVNLSIGVSPLGALGISLGNTLEAIMGAYLLDALDFRPSLERIRDVVGFVCVAALLSTFTSAIIGTTSSWIAGTVSASEYSKAFVSWWVGDMMGDLILAAFLFAWWQKKEDSSAEKPARSAVERVLLSLGILATSFLVFGGWFSQGTTDYIQPILLFPFLTWAALRFGPRGATGSVFIISVIAITETTLGRGPFAFMTLDKSLILLISFMGIAAFTMLMLAASVRENDKNRLKDKALLISIGDGVIAMDSKSKIIFSNPPAAAMLGREDEEIIGRDESDILVIEDERGRATPQGKSPLHLALVSGKTIETNAVSPVYIRRRDGTAFPASITVTPVIHEGKTMGAIKIFRDISEQKAIDNFKSESAVLTSAQISVPLAGIEEVVRRLEGEQLIPAVKAGLDDILFSAKRAHALLRLTALGFEGGANAPLKSFDLVDFIYSIVGSYAGLLKQKHQNLSWNKHPHKLSVTSDKSILEYIFHNMIANAIDYTPENGVIDLSLDVSEDNFIFTVKDSGIGIPEEDKQLIFKKFSRAGNAARSNAQGAGIGLYVVAEAVQLLRGKIWFESTENEGSIFHVELPLRVSIGTKQ